MLLRNWRLGFTMRGTSWNLPGLQPCRSPHRGYVHDPLELATTDSNDAKPGRILALKSVAFSVGLAKAIGVLTRLFICTAEQNCEYALANCGAIQWGRTSRLCSLYMLNHVNVVKGKASRFNKQIYLQTQPSN